LYLKAQLVQQNAHAKAVGNGENERDRDENDVAKARPLYDGEDVATRNNQIWYKGSEKQSGALDHAAVGKKRKRDERCYGAANEQDGLPESHGLVVVEREVQFRSFPKEQFWLSCRCRFHVLGHNVTLCCVMCISLVTMIPIPVALGSLCHHRLCHTVSIRILNESNA
jgi:hypothetical protein